MWHDTSRRLAFMFCIGALAAFSFYAKQQPRDFIITARSDYVLLDVSVTDRRGTFVTDLTKDDFRVYEDGKRRVIRDFIQSDAPVTLGLVVDNSGSMANKRGDVIAAGLSFARQSNPKDQFFVINFNDSVTRGLPPAMAFTDQLQLLKQALYRGRPEGQTALYDAVAYALHHLQGSPIQRRTLVVVSDGRDNVSQLRLPALMRQIEESQATIYCIGLFDATEDSNGRVLQKMSTLSGGRSFEPKSRSEIETIFNHIAEDIRHRYTLGFVPNEVDDKKEIHRLKIVATSRNHRKLTVISRTSYRIPRDAGKPKVQPSKIEQAEQR